MDKIVNPIYRTRCCAICFRDEKILMVQILDKVNGRKYWMPPGGGLEFDESHSECARRETLEETGQIVVVHPETQITKTYSFEFQDSLYITETHFLLAEWLGADLNYDVKDREEEIFSCEWVPLKDVFQRLSSHEEIQLAVYELIFPLIRSQNGSIDLSESHQLFKKT